MNDHTYLFAGNELSAVMAAHERKVYQEIDKIVGDELLKTSPSDLAEYFVSEFAIVVPVLDEASITVSEEESDVDVSRDPMRAIWDRSRPVYIKGTKLTLHVPFEGDPGLFNCAPSQRYMGSAPSGTVSDGRLDIAVTVLDHDEADLKARVEREMKMIRDYLSWMSADADRFNEALPEKVRTHIDARRDKLLKDRGLAASLGYKLKTREDAARTFAVPTQRRKPPIERPKPSDTEPFMPEPELLEKEYEYILGILSSMVTVIERSPGAFKRMKEEDLRQQFLVQLNGHYEGGASGETFNFEGKTDILIREQDRNIFVAECKFWAGPKTLTETVDQLLGYTTWRDAKTAIILFNRTKNLSAVLSKVPGVMEAHPNFKAVVAVAGETRFRYVFSHRDDPNREITITVLVFEVPV